MAIEDLIREKYGSGAQHPQENPGRGDRSIEQKIKERYARPKKGSEVAPRDLTPEQVFTGTRNPLNPDFWNADAAQTALGTLFTFDREGQKNIWEKQLTDAGIEHEWVADEQGSPMLRYKDKQGQWKQGYINSPGFSGADALKPAAMIGAFGSGGNVSSATGQGIARIAPAISSKVGQLVGKNIVTRGAVNAAGAATGQTAMDEVAQQAGADLPLSQRLQNAGVAAGFGFMAEPVAKMLGAGASRVMRAVRGKPSAAQVNTLRKTMGEATDGEVRKMFEDASDEFYQRLAKDAQNITDPDDLRNLAIYRAYQEEIPGFEVMRPYITRNVDDWQAFDEAARGGYGRDVQRQIGQTKQANERAVGERIGTLQDEIVQGRSVADDPVQAGGVVQQGMKQRADDLWQQIDDAYAEAGSRNGQFNVAAAKHLDETVTNRLKESRFVGRKGQLPQDMTNARDALSEIDDIVRSAADEGRPLTFQEFESTRQYLNTLRGAAQGKDKAAVNSVIRAYDDWGDDMLNRALYQGDDQAIESFKQARRLRAEYGEKFSPKDIRTRSGRKVQDRAGKVVEDIAELDLGPEQVINNVFGRGKLGQSKESVEILRRLENVLGKQSPEWNALREAGYMRIFYDKAGNPKSATQIVNTWDELTQGDGKYWANRLFGDDMGKMERFVKLLDRTRMPRDAYTPSGPAVKRVGEGLFDKALKMGARIKFPVVSQWVDNAVNARVDKAMTKAGEGALKPYKPVYMPSANLRRQVLASGVAGSEQAPEGARKAAGAAGEGLGQAADLLKGLSGQ